MKTSFLLLFIAMALGCAGGSSSPTIEGVQHKIEERLIQKRLENNLRVVSVRKVNGFPRERTYTMEIEVELQCLDPRESRFGIQICQEYATGEIYKRPGRAEFENSENGWLLRGVVLEVHW